MQRTKTDRRRVETDSFYTPCKCFAVFPRLPVEHVTKVYEDFTTGGSSRGLFSDCEILANLRSELYSYLWGARTWEVGSPSLVARPTARGEADLHSSQEPGGDTAPPPATPQACPAPCQYDLMGLPRRGSDDLAVFSR